MADARSQAEEFYAAAVACSREGRLEEALLALRSAESIDPDDPRHLHLTGSILLSLKRWNEAEDCFRRVIALLPDFRPAYLQCAEAASKNGDVEDSLAFLRHALALDYEDADTHYNLGTFLQAQSRLDQAAFHFTEAIRMQPRFAGALYNLGVACLGLNETEKAVDAFIKAREASPRDPNILRNLAYSLRRLQKHAEAIAVYRELIALQPGDSGNHYDLGATLLAARCFSEAAEAFREAVRLEPRYAPAHSNLTQALFQAGCFDQAQQAGYRALTLKDAESMEQAGEGVAFISGGVDASVRRKKKVIAFSLWGDRPTYTVGAIENAKNAKDIYPEWTCRFYLDSSVPDPVVRALERLGAELRFCTRQTPQEGLFWRFQVANDDEAGYFLVRDCDSRLNRRERAAVDDWLASGKPFHIMRDHLIHTELILAGMWGGVAGLLPEIEAMAAPYYRHSYGRWSDQLFLKEKVWPLIKHHSVIHDAYYKLFGARSFPTGDEAEPQERVAASHVLTPFSSP